MRTHIRRIEHHLHAAAYILLEVDFTWLIATGGACYCCTVAKPCASFPRLDVVVSLVMWSLYRGEALREAFAGG